MRPAAKASQPSFIQDHATLYTAIFVIAVAGVALAAERWDMAVYVLSFWHYFVYSLAFFWRQIPLQRFKRDAIVLKTISLAALAFVFLQTVPNIYSVIVMTAGFSLNIAAAHRLGSDRTYYGYELGRCPPEWIASFPYSVMPHPMLIGNIAAYGGMLLDDEFRLFWWPLALLHMLFNSQILLMEIYGGKSPFFGTLLPLAGFFSGSILLIAGFQDVGPFALVAVLIGLIFGVTLFWRYSAASGHDMLGEKLP